MYSGYGCPRAPDGTPDRPDDHDTAEAPGFFYKKMNAGFQRVYSLKKTKRNVNFKRDVMKKTIAMKWGAVLVAVACMGLAFRPDAQIKGWFLAGSQKDAYQIGLEKSAERHSQVAYLKSVAKAKGFGTIMQNFIPDDYLGKRVKLTAYIKSKDVRSWAGMWFRVDGAKGNVLSFDNMQDRPIKGTTGWKQYQIVLNVPKSAKGIAYGVLLAGTGTVWMDDFTFEIVGESTSDGSGTQILMHKPQNTGFESVGD
jgi:hypothetical protein